VPLDRLVLFVVIAAAAVLAALWLGALAAALWATPLAWLVAIPVAVVGWIVFRVVSDRLSSREDDHYDRME